MFKIKVATNLASTTRCELLTKGQIGAQVQFMFNDHWTDMKKTAVFKRCGKTIDVVDSEWNGDIVTVPPEMTEEAGLQVYVGVYGVSEDGKRITPTLYAPLGAVALGAEPDGDPSTDPTLPVWAQLQAQIGNLTTEDKTSLVAAINEAAKSGGGGFEYDFIIRITEDEPLVLETGTYASILETLGTRPINGRLLINIGDDLKTDFNVVSVEYLNNELSLYVFTVPEAVLMRIVINPDNTVTYAE